jgi:hypothetical protein
LDLTEPVRQAIGALPEQAWQPALDADGRPRHSAWAAELASLELASSSWPEGTRAICRRERPHPGAAHKTAFTDQHGHRFQVLITNQTDPDPAVLEARHRPHAHVEDRIRTAKASGLRNLPFWGFAANDAWLSLVMIAQTLVCWAQALLLDGDLAVAEPKTLRYRLWLPPAGSSITPAASSSASIAPGPGPTTWSPRLAGYGPCRCAAKPAHLTGHRCHDPPDAGHAGIYEQPPRQHAHPSLLGPGSRPRRQDRSTLTHPPMPHAWSTLQAHPNLAI